ncbi:M36 family metallopeptidase [Hymenobacter convexus]|uniref:M36 family metallopeptidase n=1 Tax=Hymenobacter sp. CA1UV-4 TaxID=3063782 RepID=UPI0027131538|nr:M36 family metallopeptidase [Hymenobacter sp. CA1UV-4]MDO7850258.1 M36 family metallopeptidase [Hymenobacter sp. CA1UV-4]
MTKNYCFLLLLLALLLPTAWLPARAQTETAQQATELALRTQAQWAGTAVAPADLRITKAYTEPSGLLYAYAQQLRTGIPVYNQVVTLVFKDGKLRHHAGRFLPAVVFDQLSATPKVTAATAVAAAVATLPDASGERPTPQDSPSGPDQQQSFAPGGVARRPLVVRLVWVVSQGQPHLAWNVNVDVRASADWLNIRVDALTGQVLEKDNWTVHEAAARPAGRPGAAVQPLRPARPLARPRQRPASPQRTQTVTPASYTVVPYPRENPTVGSVQTETNPWQKAGTGNNATTHGWHFDGTTNYTDTRGNNVWAYDDSLNADAPGRFAATTGTGGALVFNYTPDFSKLPWLGKNRRAATVNLFYWNNILHDVLYQYGLTEAAGNFQTDNLGRGGTGGDFVRAEAQDGSGTSNANFSTPPDGTSGRMQMYLYGGPVNQSLVVASPAAVAGSYNMLEGYFGPNNRLANLGPVSGELAYYTSPTNASSHTGCTAASSVSVSGKIAVVSAASGCYYVDRVVNAQNNGAIAVIVVSTGDAGLMTAPNNAMNASLTIPAVMISSTDGGRLTAQLQAGTTVRATLQVPPPMLDGDYDSGIVAHEFGHGVSNRLTGGGTNTSCLYNAEQGGEGWSDYFALMMTTDWTTAQTTDGPKSRGEGAYAVGLSAPGSTIRRYPYTTDMTVNPLTYANMATSPEAHDIGEIWCTTLWDMTWNIIQQQSRIEPNLYASTSTGGNAVALQLVMHGLKLQPCQPGFLDSRDAILAADSLLYNGRYHCAIWNAFARRGMGFSAREGSSNSATDQTVAFDLPAVTLRKNTTPVVGSQFDITLAATCECAAAQSTYTVSDQLPADLQYLSSSGGTLGANNTVTFANQTFTTGQQRLYRIRAQTASGKGCAVALPVNDDRDANQTGLTAAVVSGSGGWTTSTAAEAHAGAAAWKAPGLALNQNYTLTSAAFTPGPETLLSFYHYDHLLYYDTNRALDGGLVGISTDNGATWQDAGAYFVQGGYNMVFYNSTTYVPRPRVACFGGADSGPSAELYKRSVLDLSSFSGQSILIRFQLLTGKRFAGSTYGYTGWYLDDIKVMSGCGGPQQVKLLDGSNAVADSYNQPTFLLAPAPPAIASFSPNPGTAGQAVTVTGTNLFNISGLTVNGVAVPAAAILSNSSTSATFRVPLTAAASGTTTITTPLGTASSTALAVVAATPPGNALAFDGTDDYVSLPLLVSNDFTIETWVNTTQTGGTGTQWWQGAGLVDGEVGGATNDLGLTLLGSKAAFGLGNAGSADYTIISSVNINDGRWHHLAATRQGATLQLYVDGVLDASGTGAGTGTRNSPTLRLGAIQSGAGGYFSGRLDELRVYSAVLTQANIRADMQSTASAVPASLTAYFNFDQGTPGGTNTGQNILFDQTASAYAGTVTNASLAGTASNWVESYAMVTPTATAATGLGTTSFVANWTAPAVGTANSYLLDVATNSTFTAPISGSPFSVAGGTLSRTLTGLSANTAYYYRVRAEKTSLLPQGQGNPSNTIAVTTRCAVTAVAQNASATLAIGGTASITAAQLNNGSSSPCTPLTVGAQKIMTAVVTEGGTLTLTAPTGQVFTAVTFASYGTPTRNANGTYTASSCHAPVSQSVMESILLNKNSGSIVANNTNFAPDPCQGVVKQLVVQAVYGAPLSQLSYACTETGDNLVLLTATAGTGSATAVATATISPPVQASATWNGSIGTDWTDCRNWDYGLAPSATVGAVLPTGKNNYPALPNGTTATVASLTIDNGATLTLSHLATLQVNGNFANNSSTTTFNGNLVLNGTSAQTLGSITSIAQLQVNKASGIVTLTRDLAIGTSLTMTSGMLQTTTSYKVVLGSTATLAETDASYVAGTVAATRPLAAGTAENFGGLGLTLQPATGSVAPGSTLVLRTTGAVLTGAGTSKSILRSFDIRPTTNSGLNVTLAFSYFAHELNGIPVANLALFKSTSGTTPWILQRGTTAAGNTVSKTGIADFSVWTLGNSAAPLPVELTEFTAERQEADGLLRWATASEKNNDYFAVESSLDGQVFQPLGRVAGHGTSAQRQDYRFVDKNLARYAAEQVYYRLRQVDQDGTATFSPVRNLQVPAMAGFAVQAVPNPSHDAVSLTIRTGTAGPATVLLFDALGRQLGQMEVNLPVGTSSLPLDAARGLPTGVYLLRVRQGSQQQSVKLVRE